MFLTKYSLFKTQGDVLAKDLFTVSSTSFAVVFYLEIVKTAVNVCAVLIKVHISPCVVHPFKHASSETRRLIF